MATMSVSGVVSGMDWDSMIDEIITNAAKPAQVKVSKRQNLTNKKSLFEEMKVTMNSLQSSLTTLKIPSTYKAKQVDIERIDTNGSYKGVLTATVNADAEVNVYDLKVNKLARAQTNRSKQITASTVGSALSDYNLNSGTMYINMAGQKVGIEINSNDSLQSIKSRINNTLKTLDIPVEVTASVVDNRLIIRSDNTGLGANSMTETLTYNLNNKNTITAFSVNDADLTNGNFVIRNSSGTKMTYGKDYDLVNGNEIRWNPYEETDEVKLGNSVTATYAMAAGDVINKSGYIMGTDTVNVKTELGFLPKYTDNLKIKTDSAEYTYGRDFTINSSGDLEWIAVSNVSKKPSGSYTISYGTGTSYTRTMSSSRDYIRLDGFYGYEELREAYRNSTGNELPTLQIGGTLYIDDTEAFKIDGYEYGKDFVLRRSSTGTYVTLAWAGNQADGDTISSFVSSYAQAKGISTNGFKCPDLGETFTLNFGTSYSATVPADDDGTSTLQTLLGVGDSFSDYENMVITDEYGNNYYYGQDYTVENGVIVWGTTPVNPDATQPASGEKFSLVYTSKGPAVPLETTINAGSFSAQGSSLQMASLRIRDDDGNVLTMQDILDDLGVTDYDTTTNNAAQQTVFDAAAQGKFVIVDANGNEYTYGSRADWNNGTGSGDFFINTANNTPTIRWYGGGDISNFGTTDPAFPITVKYTGKIKDVSDMDPETVELSVKRSNTDAIQSGTSGTSPLYSYFDGGTSTITQGTKTFYEGTDYTIEKITTTDENGHTITNAAVQWKTGTNSEWYYPTSNAAYTINLTTSTGSSLSFQAVREPSDTLDLRDYGFTSVNGSITSLTYQGSSTHTYDLTSTDTDDDGDTPTKNMADEIGLNISDSTNGGFKTFSFDWVTPERTANADLPSAGGEFKAEYTYNANTFTLSDDSDGSLLAAFELDQTDSDHYMAAQNAELVLDGETITRDSNDIGEAYENELIKGMTIHLKGTGEVSLDVSHDAEKAVESIQTFVDTYNDLMTWMNTRMTEKQVDENTKATIDSDDFRMRWGLLHGNAILRQTKAKMRSITSQNFTFSFTQRSSAEEVYGTMGFNGLRNDATLRLRINSKFVDVSILPTDTLQDIVDKINDDSEDGPMHDIYYDDNGEKLKQPLLKASVENDRLVITSTNNDSITMSGTSAMNALKMNYTYKGLYQLGIATTATDYGKSGELEFDTSKFMEALEDNPDEVQELMLMFVNDFDTWTKSMLTTSASGETSGTLTREIENLDNQIKTIDEYLERYQERLDRQEESLRTRYGNTETQLAKLSQQANSIAAILNQLNGYTNNNSSSSSS